MNVILNITDVCCTKCFKNSKELQVTVTSTSQTINLQDGFSLNVIQVTGSYITCIIQNSVYVIIRNIYTTFPVKICLPSKKCTHLLSIGVTL